MALAPNARPLSDLRGYERNPRTHSPAQIGQLVASIREWGFTIPVLVDESGMIIAGHGRVEAARLAGLDSVPVVVAEGWTEAQKRAYVIADNQLTLAGGWDTTLLGAEVKALEASGLDVALLGFTSEELAGLLRPAMVGLTDPDDAPPASTVAVAVPGDVWNLGRHRVLCGDATQAEAVALLLGEHRPHLMVTDPPYGVDYDPAWRQRAGVSSAGAASGRVLNDDRADWREAWALFPGTVAYVWHGGLHADVVALSLKAVKFSLRAQIVWVKTRAALSRGHYHWQHEPVLYAVREGQADDGWRFQSDHDVASYAVRDGATADWRGGRKQSTVWFIEHLKSDTGHGTQKPVACMQRPIENNSSHGQSIYDPFLGSGTTVIAAEITGRSCFGLELNPVYVDVIVKRWQAFTGAVATLDGVPFADVAAAREAA